jgi:hypothetical protein
MNDEVSLDVADAFQARGAGQKFTLYVPNQDKNGEPIDQGRWVDAALRLFSRLFGGATVFPHVRGAWLNPETRQLIVEEPQLVYSFVTAEAFVLATKELHQFMLFMGRETHQGQIGFEFDGTFFLLDIQETDHGSSR